MVSCQRLVLALRFGKSWLTCKFLKLFDVHPGKRFLDLAQKGVDQAVGNRYLGLFEHKSASPMIDRIRD